jgi:RNA polymerase sigma-70 factor (ECF subfamily)
MDEKKIIKEILAGDTEQYRFLLQRYQPGLVHHCFSMVNDSEAANDITQEACIKAFIQLKNYNEQYRFSTWLYKIATNLSFDYLKKRRHVSLDDIPEPLSESLSPQDQAIKNESAYEMQQAVRKLPVKYQTVISLYYWQDRNYEEIAEILTIPLGTVRTWLKRAKDHLREELNG